MIVKVQQSLFSSGEPTMLVYNESRTVMYEAPLPLDVKELLGERPKAYFKAKLVGTIVELGKEISAKNW